MKARRKPVKFFIALFFLSACLALYLRVGLLPGNLKVHAIRKIEELTQKKVTFEKTVFLPFEGLSFTRLKVSDRDGTAVFSAKKLSLNVRWVPFFKEKKIVISRATLDSPVTDYLFDAASAAKPPPPKTKISRQIPIPLIPEGKKIGLDSIEEGPNAFLPENVYLEEIQITDGRVAIRQNRKSPPLEEIHSIHARLTFRDPPVLKLDGSFQCGRPAYARTEFHGTWNLKNAHYEFRLASKSARVPRWLADYQKNNFLILHDAQTSLELSLKSSTERKASFHGAADLKNARLAVRQWLSSGHMAAEVDGVFNFEKLAFESYSGALDFVDVAISPGPLEKISGSMYFEPDLLKINALGGTYKNIPFESSGTIRSFKAPLVQATIRTRSDISQLLSLVPAPQKRSLEGFDIRGRCEAVTFLEGSLKKPAEIRSRHRLIFSDGSISHPAKKISLTQVYSEIELAGADVRVEQARFLWEGERVSMRLAASYHGDPQIILIDTAQIEGAGVLAAFRGKISDLSEPRLDLRGDADIHLARIQPFLEKKNPALKDMGLDGTLKGNFILKGRLKDPLAWDFKMDAQSPRVTVKRKWRLDKFSSQIRMRNRILNIPYFHALPYRGVFGGQAFFDLSKPAIPFQSKAYANNVDLSLLAKDLGLAQDVSGTLLFQAALGGELKSQETWRGAGSVDIRDGKLWKTNLFKKMGDLPFVKVLGLDEVVFRDLHADFEIRDKKIWTENLRLLSETVSLTFKGTMGFDQALNLIMSIQYSNDILRGAFSTGGIVPFVIQEAERLISEYRISGTLAQPKFEK